MAIAAFFAVIGFAIAHSLGFFVALPKKPLQTISWKDTIQVFLVFLLLQFFLIPLILLLVVQKGGYSLGNIEVMGWLNTSSALLLTILLTLFLLCFKKEAMQKFFYSKQPAEDLLLGCLTWCLAFPCGLVFSLLMQILLGDYLGFSLDDQLAVKQIKGILPYPTLLFAAVIMIVFLIPVVEETLFRGFLQTSLRGFCSPGSSIAISSLIFALFHFSMSQGVNNINILGSLFFLSFFLGYLRERQGNCLAPIALHSTFNAISIAMVLNGLN